MTYIQHSLKIFLCLALVLSLATISVSSHAQSKAPIIIRDTEIENTFKEWLAPLLEAAGLGPESVNLILVQSPQVNAFVAGGANIFVYTGLIEKTDKPGELIGVLAHELGHVAGGHLISTRQALERASYESILGTVLGIGAAIVTGDGGAATAVIVGSGGIAQSHFLAHSRINESSADQAALKFFEESGINPEGLSSFLNKLKDDELLPADQQREYVRTHPLTHNRIGALQANINASAHKDTPLPEAWDEQHARMKAKLLGFIDPGRVPWVYDDRDQSIAARSARAIAAYKQNDVATALRETDEIIAMEPNNPYFQELKGQMLVDFGRVKESIPYYRHAVSILPDAGLIRIALGHALLETHGDENAMQKEAIQHLKRALQDEPRSGKVHRLLATAYGRQGHEDLAKLHLAEEAVLQRRLDYAQKLAEAALSSFKENTNEWLRAKDILSHIKTLKKDA